MSTEDDEIYIDSLMRSLGFDRETAALVVAQVNADSVALSIVPPITKSSGCVFFDINAPCQERGCLICKNERENF